MIVKDPGVVFTPATRHGPASSPQKRTPGIVLNTATRHSLQPMDFLKILAAIPAESKYVSDPTRPVPAQYIPSIKKGWKTDSTWSWVSHAAAPAPYHLKSNIRLSHGTWYKPIRWRPGPQHTTGAQAWWTDLPATQATPPTPPTSVGTAGTLHINAKEKENAKPTSSPAIVGSLATTQDSAEQTGSRRRTEAKRPPDCHPKTSRSQS
jgi:hypothetical protein